MYRARGPIQNWTGEPLNDKYFTQVLLPNYMNDNPEKTADWDVAYDARGHFLEPHAGTEVALGTLAGCCKTRGGCRGAEKRSHYSFQVALIRTGGRLGRCIGVSVRTPWSFAAAC